MARITAQAKEAFFQTAALQVGFELPLDVIRQRPAGFRTQRTKRGIVLLHQPTCTRSLDTDVSE